MKIAIPADEKLIDKNVYLSFGRAPFFLIYDIETKESIFLENSAALSQGGAGIKAAQNIVDNDVEVLLVPRCGGNAADVLNAANIKIYKTINGSIEANIEAFNNEELSILDEIHPGFHNHGKE